MPQVSIFKNVGEPQSPTNMDLIEYLEKTRDGKWEDLVNQCRVIKDKELRDEFKRTMPTTTLSGVFSYRADNKLVEHTRYIAMDLDDVDDMDGYRRSLIRDKYVFSVFMSTSGTGYRVLFKIDPEKHRESFQGIASYLWSTYGMVVDSNGINVSKPFVVSFDPNMYINYENVPVFKKYVKETPIKRIPDFVHTASDFDSIIKQISGRNINICEDYSDWLKVGFAIAEQFGEDGRFYFHEVSRFSSKYNAKATDQQYKACMKARGQSKANISSFYYLAKINGVNICSENTKKIVRYTRNGKRAGLSKPQIAENLLKHENINNADKVIEKVFESDDDSNYSDDESLLHQLEMFISSNYNLKMNEVTGYLEQNSMSLSPSYLNTIFIAAKKLIPKLDYPLMMRLLKSDFIETYNPFYKFFGSDGIPVELPAIPVENKGFKSPLIDRLAETIENDNPAFTLFFLRKWMVGIISAAHKVHSPLLLCLLGAQNSGKTEFFRRLLPPELRSYYAESKLDKEKDDELLMTENLIIMDDELGGKSKQDALKLKNITSKQYFSLRRPYGDHNEKILRLAVLCGTSNYKAILSDDTGNRRIIPVEVKDIKKDLYNSIDKKELFMEAFRLYKEGFDWRITQKDIEFLNKDQDKYTVTVKERDLLERYFTPGDDHRMTSTDILVDIENITNQRLNLTIVGRELEKLGFVRKTTRMPNGSTPKMWCVTKQNRVEAGSNIWTPADSEALKKKEQEKPKDDLPF